MIISAVGRWLYLLGETIRVMVQAGTTSRHPVVISQVFSTAEPSGETRTMAAYYRDRGGIAFCLRMDTMSGQAPATQ